MFALYASSIALLLIGSNHKALLTEGAPPPPVGGTKAITKRTNMRETAAIGITRSDCNNFYAISIYDPLSPPLSLSLRIYWIFEAYEKTHWCSAHANRQTLQPWQLLDWKLTGRLRNREGLRVRSREQAARACLRIRATSSASIIETRGRRDWRGQAFLPSNDSPKYTQLSQPFHSRNTRSEHSKRRTVWRKRQSTRGCRPQVCPGEHGYTLSQEETPVPGDEKCRSSHTRRHALDFTGPHHNFRRKKRAPSPPDTRRGNEKTNVLLFCCLAFDINVART